MSPNDDARPPVTERRFSEAEVAAIFAQASEAQDQSHDRQLPSGEGLTLAELRDIGREVGISSDEISKAANSLARGGAPVLRGIPGFPIAVRQTIDLGRKLSDEEWERLVVDLRETFDARGVLRRDGSLRQWTNGNLQALLEPTDSGDRLRLRTTNGDARRKMVMGTAMFVGAVVALLSGTTHGALTEGAMLYSGLFAMMGAGVFAFGALGLPGWAKERQRQMIEIAARLAGRTQASLERPAPRLPDIP